MVQSHMGKTRRSKIYCARKFAFDRVVLEIADKKISKSYNTNENISQENMDNLVIDKISKSESKEDDINEINTIVEKKKKQITSD